MSRYHHNPVNTTPIFSRRTSSTMPSMRRIKIFSLFIVMVFITLLLYSSSRSSSIETGDFLSKTKSALERTPVGGGASTAGKGKVVGTSDDDKEASRARLMEAAQLAKDNANLKAPKPDPPSKVVGIGSAAEGAEKSVAGRKKFNAGVTEAQVPVKEKEEEESQEEEELKAEFNSILKKAPIIIFSKSYCPHSARAKGILLEKYLIDPKPHVVELDLHPLGPKLQAKLADLTGRRTVPNVLINGVSIGGGDDVAELDETRKLVDKVRDLGGKRMLEVKLRALEEVKENVKVKVDEEKDEGHGL